MSQCRSEAHKRKICHSSKGKEIARRAIIRECGVDLHGVKSIDLARQKRRDNHKIEESEKAEKAKQKSDRKVPI